jgi:hypothetical protein
MAAQFELFAHVLAKSGDTVLDTTEQGKPTA